MEKFVKGDVVVVPFPFSDLTEAKRRPALVLAELDRVDRILCQIILYKAGHIKSDKIHEVLKKIIDILAN